MEHGRPVRSSSNHPVNVIPAWEWKITKPTKKVLPVEPSNNRQPHEPARLHRPRSGIRRLNTGVLNRPQSAAALTRPQSAAARSRRTPARPELDTPPVSPSASLQWLEYSKKRSSSTSRVESLREDIIQIYSVLGRFNSSIPEGITTQLTQYGPSLDKDQVHIAEQKLTIIFQDAIHSLISKCIPEGLDTAPEPSTIRTRLEHCTGSAALLASFSVLHQVQVLREKTRDATEEKKVATNESFRWQKELKAAQEALVLFKDTLSKRCENKKGTKVQNEIMRASILANVMEEWDTQSQAVALQVETLKGSNTTLLYDKLKLEEQVKEMQNQSVENDIVRQNLDGEQKRTKKFSDENKGLRENQLKQNVTLEALESNHRRAQDSLQVSRQECERLEISSTTMQREWKKEKKELVQQIASKDLCQKALQKEIFNTSQQEREERKTREQITREKEHIRKELVRAQEVIQRLQSTTAGASAGRQAVAAQLQTLQLSYSEMQQRLELREGEKLVLQASNEALVQDLAQVGNLQSSAATCVFDELENAKKLWTIQRKEDIDALRATQAVEMEVVLSQLQCAEEGAQHALSQACTIREELETANVCLSERRRVQRNERIEWEADRASAASHSRELHDNLRAQICTHEENIQELQHQLIVLEKSNAALRGDRERAVERARIQKADAAEIAMIVPQTDDTVSFRGNEQIANQLQELETQATQISVLQDELNQERNVKETLQNQIQFQKAALQKQITTMRRKRKMEKKQQQSQLSPERKQLKQLKLELTTQKRNQQAERNRLTSQHALCKEVVALIVKRLQIQLQWFSITDIPNPNLQTRKQTSHPSTQQLSSSLDRTGWEKQSSIWLEVQARLDDVDWQLVEMKKRLSEIGEYYNEGPSCSVSTTPFANALDAGGSAEQVLMQEQCEPSEESRMSEESQDDFIAALKAEMAMMQSTYEDQRKAVYADVRQERIEARKKYTSLQHDNDEKCKTLNLRIIVLEKKLTTTTLSDSKEFQILEKMKTTTSVEERQELLCQLFELRDCASGKVMAQRLEAEARRLKKLQYVVYFPALPVGDKMSETCMYSADELLVRIETEEPTVKREALQQFRSLLKQHSSHVELLNVRRLLNALRRRMNDFDSIVAGEAVGLLCDIIPTLEIDNIDLVLTLIVPHAIRSLSRLSTFTKTDKTPLDILWTYAESSDDMIGVTDALINIGITNDDNRVRESSILAIKHVLTKENSSTVVYAQIDYQELLTVLVSCLEDNDSSVIVAAEETLGVFKSTCSSFDSFAKRLGHRDRLLLHDHFEYISQFVYASSSRNSDNDDDEYYSDSDEEECNLQEQKNTMSTMYNNPQSVLFGFVPENIIQNIQNGSKEEDNRVRIQGCYHLLQLVQEDDNCSIDRRTLFSTIQDNQSELLDFIILLVEDKTCHEVVKIALDILCKVMIVIGSRIKAHLPTILPVLLEKLGNTNTKVRNGAVSAFGVLIQSMSNSSLFLSLRGAFNHSNAHIREEGVKLLMLGILSRPSQQVPLNEVLPDLIQLLCDPNEAVQDAALDVCAIVQSQLPNENVVFRLQEAERNTCNEIIDFSIVQQRLDDPTLPRINGQGMVDSKRKYTRGNSIQKNHRAQSAESPRMQVPSMLDRQHYQDNTIYSEKIQDDLPDDMPPLPFKYRSTNGVVPVVRSVDLFEKTITEKDNVVDDKVRLWLPKTEEHLHNSSLPEKQRMASKLTTLKKKSRRGPRRAISATAPENPRIVGKQVPVTPMERGSYTPDGTRYNHVHDSLFVQKVKPARQAFEHIEDTYIDRTSTEHETTSTSSRNNISKQSSPYQPSPESSLYTSTGSTSTTKQESCSNTYTKQDSTSSARNRSAPPRAQETHVENSQGEDRPIRPMKDPSSAYAFNEEGEFPSHHSSSSSVKPKMVSKATQQRREKMKMNASPLKKKMIPSTPTKQRIRLNVSASPTSFDSSPMDTEGSGSRCKEPPASSFTPKGSSSSDAMYKEDCDLRSFTDPRKALVAVSKSLKSKDWALNVEGLDTLRRLAYHHSEVLTNKILHEACKDVLKQVNNLRSSVAKNAMLAIETFVIVLQKNMDSEIDSVLPVLFKRYSDTNAFLSTSADRVLLSIVAHSSSSRILAGVMPMIHSKTSSIRCSVARTLHRTIAKMGHRFTAYKEMDRVLVLLGKLLSDSNGDVRDMTKDCLCYIIHHDILAISTLKRTIPSSALSKVEAYIKSGKYMKSSISSISTSSSSSTNEMNIKSKISIKMDTYSQETINNINPIDVGLESIIVQLQSSNWRERNAGIESLRILVSSSSSSEIEKCQVIPLFEALFSVLGDGNGKVCICALETVCAILPFFEDALDPVLSGLLSCLGHTLANSHTKTSELSASAIQILCDCVSPARICPLLVELIKKSQGSKTKVIMIKVLQDVIQDVVACCPSLMKRQILPLSYSLLEESKNDVRTANKHLLRRLYTLMGNDLLDYYQDIPQCNVAKIRHALNL